ncbi:spindle assembly abnormal protein 6 homolog [Uloborus diversus]|uniref:spindle assembly abnormal protein 6 homolog n=1 Tax=Uloborus diversus TaxID=327109 RepID=UPI00240A2C66|nr:spindle assembly abnormal protein 6 homolog [Uloborus diversus]
MLPSDTDEQKLFSKTVPVTIKDTLTSQIRSSRLLLSIEWQKASSGVYGKELVVSLTDNNDPFFLYNLHLTEDDFQSLKTSQGLLVDFSAFPQKFIELIELCMHEESSTTPKFILTFNVNDRLGNISSPSNLDVIETNPFKHLTHLSIKLVVASESAVKQYLVSCFRNLKEDKLQLQNRLTFLEKEFKEKSSDYQETLRCKARELEAVKRDLSAELATLENKYSRDLQVEKEKYQNKLKEEESRIEKERREKDKNFRKQIQQLEARVNALDNLNKELQESNFRKDDLIRELRAKIQSLEDEERRLNVKLNAIKRQRDDLESEVRHKGQLKNKITELENELYNQKQAMHKQQNEIEAHHKEKRGLETEVERLKVQISIEAKSYESLKEDLVKSNDILMKLQVEVKCNRERITEQEKVILKQESTISKDEKMIETLQQKNSEKSLELAEIKSKTKSLSEMISSLKEKNHSLEKELKNKENVIKFLNRQMTDRGIVPQCLPRLNLVPSPPSVGQILTQKPITPNFDKSPQNFASLDNAPSKLPLREENQSPSFLKNRYSPQTQLRISSYAADSAYETSPSNGASQLPTNSLKIDTALRTNEINLDIDPSALSAAFRGDRIVKHSTAKKPSSNKNLRTTKKT